MSERDVTRVEWPGFRGANRDGVVRGVRIETDWVSVAADRVVAPPRSGQAGRRSPSPAIVVYTQEQRGDDEIVSAYNLKTASPSGGTATRRGSGSRMPAPARVPRRPSATVASTPWVQPAS